MHGQEGYSTYSQCDRQGRLFARCTDALVRLLSREQEGLGHIRLSTQADLAVKSGHTRSRLSQYSEIRITISGRPRTSSEPGRILRPDQ